MKTERPPKGENSYKLRTLKIQGKGWRNGNEPSEPMKRNEAKKKTPQMITGTPNGTKPPDHSPKLQLFESEPPTNGTPRPKKQRKPERSLKYWKMETKIDDNVNSL